MVFSIIETQPEYNESEQTCWLQLVWLVRITKQRTCNSSTGKRMSKQERQETEFQRQVKDNRGRAHSSANLEAKWQIFAIPGPM